MTKVMRLLLLIIIYLLPFMAFAQSGFYFCNEIESKKTIKSFEKAVDFYKKGNLTESEIILLKISDEEKDFTEVWYLLSEIYYSQYNSATNPKLSNISFQKYIRCLEYIVASCPQFNKYEYNYILGKHYFNRDENQKALQYLNVYLSNADKNSKNYKDAQNTYDYINTYLNLVNSPVLFNPVVVEGLSTVNDDYLPVISPDGSIAFFTKAYMKKDLNSVYVDKFTEEFTMATSSDDSGLKFSNTVPMPFPFNTGKNQGAASITIDNSILYITICEFVSRDYDNCDIYYSVKRGNNWSELIRLGPEINGINSWESQPSISADGKTLYFASIRPGNVGFDPNNPTSDIWYSTKKTDGTWSKAKNLGPPINTPGNEKSPFIHSDSQTLYFSSDGHPGLGGYDIFFSKFRDSIWTQPVNMGYPINTKSDDLGFIVNTQGTKAYFASNKLNGLGGWDIYAFDLYPEARPEKVMLIKGQIITEYGDSLNNAKLEIRNTRTKEINEGIINEHDGNYAVAVTTDSTQNDSYLLLVKKENYSFASALIEPSVEIIETPIQIDFEIKPIEKGKTVELNDIYFATNSYTIEPKSFPVLDAFADFLKENPKIKIEIRGHTDNVGSLQMNMTLSNQRAKAVYDYLINIGIEPTRMRFRGYGPNMPIADNNTEAGRAKNRRTEFFILE
ncbi:MAG TPA: OmpA family protein [Bacteroidales bacterium]|nr:OmpA family protein [Bacteroidales bacterium]